MSNSTKTSPKSTWEPKENAEFFAGITWELSTLGANGKQAGWPADKVEAFKALKSRIRGAVTYAELNAASISPDAVKALKDIYEIVKGSSNEANWEAHSPQNVKRIEGQLAELENVVGKLERAMKI